jgi:Class II flagellar assembly regulator
MKIDRIANTATRGTRPGARGRAGNADSFFKALAGADAHPAAPPSGVAPPPRVEAILALQEVASEPDSDTQGRRRGEELLDRLDELRLALLEGRLSVAAIERLAAQAAAGRAQARDPRLAEILNDIELRAAVELAKLGR